MLQKVYPSSRKRMKERRRILCSKNSGTLVRQVSSHTITPSLFPCSLKRPPSRNRKLLGLIKIEFLRHLQITRQIKRCVLRVPWRIRLNELLVPRMLPPAPPVLRCKRHARCHNESHQQPEGRHPRTPSRVCLGGRPAKRPDDPCPVGREIGVERGRRGGGERRVEFDDPGCGRGAAQVGHFVHRRGGRPPAHRRWEIRGHVGRRFGRGVCQEGGKVGRAVLSRKVGGRLRVGRGTCRDRIGPECGKMRPRGR
mmetsp:Transcript_9895/g.20044  ORF Transcript_9895/g.20044 Transcript_9895/m.20044 type:complete len:253 (-) Transcript_9895:896-1654(-)